MALRTDQFLDQAIWRVPLCPTEQLVKGCFPLISKQLDKAVSFYLKGI